MDHSGKKKAKKVKAMEESDEEEDGNYKFFDTPVFMHLLIFYEVHGKDTFPRNRIAKVLKILEDKNHARNRISMASIVYKRV